MIAYSTRKMIYISIIQFRWMLGDDSVPLTLDCNCSNWLQSDRIWPTNTFWMCFQNQLQSYCLPCYKFMILLTIFQVYSRGLGITNYLGGQLIWMLSKDLPNNVCSNHLFGKSIRKTALGNLAAVVFWVQLGVCHLPKIFCDVQYQ